MEGLYLGQIGQGRWHGMPLPGLWLLVLALLLINAPVGLAQSSQEKELVAVLDLHGVQASDAEAAALTNRLREGLLKRGRFTLVDRSQVNAILEEQALQQSGCTEQECAVQVGRILGVRRIVAGEVVKVSPEIWLVSGIMVDVETSQTLRAESVQHQGNFVSLMGAGMDELAGKLSGVTAPPLAQAAAISPLADATPPSESTWREPITSMEFVRIVGGTFDQGCGSWTIDCRSNEQPLQRVTVGDFWIGNTEVTQLQWKKIMKGNPSRYRGDSRPVDSISWQDAQLFIGELNNRNKNRVFRLPTEAEWEFACRAGGKLRAFGTLGDTLNEARARYNSGEGTAPVRTYPANGLGLFEMSGNVSEWVQDTIEPYQSGVWEDPLREVPGALRVLRGGGWSYYPANVRCASRQARSEDTRKSEFGFRIVMEQSAEASSRGN